MINIIQGSDEYPDGFEGNEQDDEDDFAPQEFEEQIQCLICLQYDCVCEYIDACPHCGQLDCKNCDGEDESESDSLRDMYLMRLEDEQMERERNRFGDHTRFLF